MFVGDDELLPDEYTDLILCRDLFFCPPSVLDEQDYHQVMTLLTLHNAERKHYADEAEKAKNKKGGKR